MSFDWSDYVALANELEQHGRLPPCNEAKLRCAISRAYYGAFREAYEFTRRKNWILPQFSSSGKKLGSHEQVESAFSNRGTNEPKYYLIAQKLRDMKSRRVQADYNTLFNKSAQTNDMVEILTAAEDNLLTSYDVVHELQQL